MSITQGAPLPDIKQTTTTQDNAPSYYTNYLSGLSTAGQAAMGKSPTQSVAGYDPLQVMGYGALPAAATAGQPEITAAQQTAGQAAQGITPERIQALMNPYTSNVVDEMGRLSQQNMQRNMIPTMKAGFVGTGGLGSQRYANAMGQGMADVQAGLTGQQYGALSSGYSQAMKGALDEASLLNQTAGTQGKLADIAQTEALTGAGALTKAGAERQAYQQSLLDQPLKTATNASALMRGFTVPQNQTQTFTGPKAGSYQNSTLSDISGILSVLGAAKEGSAGAKLYDWLGNKFSNLDLNNLGPNAGTNLAAGAPTYTGGNLDGYGTSYTDPNEPGYDPTAP
jgi:hypothetical protein